MKPVVPAALLALTLLLVACEPRNPLDWKVSADSPADFSGWCDRTYRRLPPDVAKEFATSLSALMAATPQARIKDEEVAWQNPNNPVCRQIDGRTVRDVIIEGLLERNAALLRRVNLNLDTVQRLTVQQAKLDPRSYDHERLGRMIDACRQFADLANAQVEKNSQRIAELTPPKA